MRYILIAALLLPSCISQSLHITVLLPSQQELNPETKVPWLAWDQEAAMFRKLGKQAGEKHLQVLQADMLGQTKILAQFLLRKKRTPDVLIWAAPPYATISAKVASTLQKLREDGTRLVLYRFGHPEIQSDVVVQPNYADLGTLQGIFLRQLPPGSPLLLLSHNSDIPEARQSYEAARTALLGTLLQHGRTRLRSLPVVFDGEWNTLGELQQIFENHIQSPGGELPLGVLCPDSLCAAEALQYRPAFLSFLGSFEELNILVRMRNELFRDSSLLPIVMPTIQPQNVANRSLIASTLKIAKLYGSLDTNPEEIATMISLEFRGIPEIDLGGPGMVLRISPTRPRP